MTTSLFHTAIFDDMDDIAVPDSAKTMSDGDGSPVDEMIRSNQINGEKLKDYRPLLALSNAICTAFSDSASNALVASTPQLCISSPEGDNL